MRIKLTTLLLSALIGMSAFGQAHIKSETLKNHVYYLAADSLEGRGWSTESGLKAAKYIAEHFEKIGLQTIGDSYFHPFKARTGQTVLEGRNVVGLIEGSDPILKNEYIVLGGHYDHISYKMVDGEKVVYNGADDNASGTAAVIELGRALKNKKLKRSIVLVAFDAEESGLIGSGWFVKQEIVPIDQIKAMMSIDMIGRYAESKSLIMGALDDVKGGKDALLKLAAEQDVKIKKTGGEVCSRTDTKPFGDAGVSAIYVTSGIVGPYHKPGDDAETLDYEGMAKISNLLASLVAEMANWDEIESSQILNAQVKKDGLAFFRLGAIYNLGGSSHAYPEQFYKGKGSFSNEAGLLMQFKITKNISLQPEVLYSTMGSGYEDGSYRTHSLTAPVSLIIGSAMNASMQQRFFTRIGGYYSYHFAGSINKQAIDFTNKFSQTEYGISYGIGLELMSVVVSVNFKHGLTNILQDDANGLIRTRGTYFSIGYIF